MVHKMGSGSDVIIGSSCQCSCAREVAVDEELGHISKVYVNMKLLYMNRYHEMNVLLRS